MRDLDDLLLIGVDGGGTGCRAAIGTYADGVLAEATGGPANVASDPARAVDAALGTVLKAAEDAGFADTALADAVAHIGLAGVMTQRDSDHVATRMPFATSTVSDDRPTTVAGALGGRDGFVVSLGTGVIAASSRAGQNRYVGGWGFHVADQGSGAWLGRAALEQVLLCHDGMASHTDLTRTLLAKFDDDPNAIVAFSLSAKPGDYAAFAADIVADATSGDPWGRHIMANGADHILRYLGALGFRAGQPLCLTGGVGPHYAAYLPVDVLGGRIDPVGSALDGAFRLARAQFEAGMERAP